ncbi:hypothetical protein D3C80_1985970 [compost metagenome]
MDQLQDYTGLPGHQPKKFRSDPRAVLSGIQKYRCSPAHLVHKPEGCKCIYDVQYDFWCGGESNLYHP